MLTLLISGSGTGVGKTRVAAVLARAFARNGHSVQIIKPVQTGLARDEPSDAETAASLARNTNITAHTLHRYSTALAPLDAAKADDKTFFVNALIRETLSLPQAGIRLIEGAGGIAVPLDSRGRDWADFASAIESIRVVLVVPDMLGAINQARLAYHYFQNKTNARIQVGIFLNAIETPSDEVAVSNRSTLTSCGVPIWGILAANSMEPSLHPPLSQWVAEKP